MLTKNLPTPRHDVIIEPFAGSACYAVTHGAGRPVVLCDADPQIAAIWRWLIGASERDVLSLPVDFGDTDIRTLGFDGPQLWLLQRWLAPQGANTNWRMPPSCIDLVRHHPGAHWSAHVRNRIASQLTAIRRWSFVECDYSEIAPVNEPATWLVDPPYQHNAHARAKYGADVTDYDALAMWCRSRPGQVIVHEQHGAVWLPFRTLSMNARTGRTVGGTMKSRHEVYWTNRMSDDNVFGEQLDIFASLAAAERANTLAPVGAQLGMF